MRPKLTRSYLPPFISAVVATGGIAVGLTAILSSGAVAAGGGADPTTLSTKLEGKGRGRAFLKLNPSYRKLCYAVHADGVDKGRVFIGKGRKGNRSHSVLTLFGPNIKHGGLRGCLSNVSTSLIRSLAAHPGQFFVAVANRRYPHGAIRGQLRHSPPGPAAAYSATDCYVYLYDDTGEGHDFATGGQTTPKPIDGTGTRYLAGEDHSVTTCIVNRTYNFPRGTIKVYAKDRLIGSNVYSCTATGIYKCFGPREGSTLKGWTLRVVYYVCIPGASPLPGYCPR